MKRSFYAVTALAVSMGITALVGACGGNNPAPPAQLPATTPTVSVTIPPNANTLGSAAYGTNPLTIMQGTTVTWNNTDSIAHTATSDTGVWDSGAIQPGGSFSQAFPTIGTFPYHCTIHGAAAMSGTINVVSSSSQQPVASPSPSVSPSPSPTVTATPYPLAR